MNIPKRTPDEWITVVRVGGVTKTVFTEGPTDARVLLAASKLRANLDFRSADEIDFDPSTTSFCGGNKARVLAVHEAFKNLLPTSPSAIAMMERARCLVDGDFNALVSPEKILTGHDVLVVTDFSNIVSCILSHQSIRQCMMAAFGWTLGHNVWKTLVEALTFAFYCRFRNALFDLGQSAPTISSHFTYALNSINFNKKSYLQSYFDVQGQPNGILQAEIEASIIAVDVRYTVNSNDLFDAIYGACRMDHSNSGALSKEQFRSVLLTIVPSKLCEDCSIQSLFDWLNEE